MGSTLGFVLFLNLFFFHQQGPVMSLFMFAGTVVYFFFELRGSKHKKVLPAVLGCSVFLLLTRMARIWSSNQAVSALLFFSSVSTVALVMYSLGMGQTVRSLWEVVAVPVRMFGGYVRGGWLAFFSLFRAQNHPPRTSFHYMTVLKSVVVGTLLAIPVIALLVSLLGGADPIFAYHIKRLFSWNIFWEIPARIWWSLILVILLNPFRFFHLKDQVRSPFSFVGRLGWHRELTVVMALVAAIVAGFLVVQSPYVFANVPAETDLSQFGVTTYSEYVKKGFGELIRVAAFLYAIVWVGLLTTRENIKKAVGILSVFQWVVMGELSLFVISVFRRIWLYQLHHGWTLVRIYGGVFLLWLSGMIVFLALRHVVKKRWVVGELVMTATVILVLGFFNVEHFIATTHPPTVNKRVDYVYLSGMSPDGYAGWEMSYDWAKDVLIDRELEMKLFLDAQDRRDVAYAGVIVYRLTRQYHRLLRDYGSDDEQRIFVHEFFKYMDALGFSKAFDETLSYWRKALDENKRSPNEFIQQIVLPEYLSFGIPFEKGLNFYSVLRPFYDTKPYDRIDRMFIWNRSSAKAYTQMKQDMSLLRGLQTAYRNLSAKITTQKDGERGYPADTYFRAPFLDSPQ